MKLLHENGADDTSGARLRAMTGDGLQGVTLVEYVIDDKNAPASEWCFAGSLPDDVATRRVAAVAGCVHVVEQKRCPDQWQQLAGDDNGTGHDAKGQGFAAFEQGVQLRCHSAYRIVDAVLVEQAVRSKQNLLCFFGRRAHPALRIRSPAPASFRRAPRRS